MFGIHVRALVALLLALGAASATKAAYAQSAAPAAGAGSAGAASGEPSNQFPRVYSISLTPEQIAAYARADKPLTDAQERADKLIKSGKLAGAERVLLDAMATARQDPLSHPLFLLPTFADIYLREGRNREVLSTLSEYCSKSGRSADLDLMICIAYCRLGDYRDALPYYDDAQRGNSSIWEYDLVGQAPRPQDWPGTASPAALQASALLARGISKQGTANYEDALRDFQAAERLAPGSPLIAYHAATMLNNLKRFKEALPYYRRAAYCANRFVAEESRRKIGSLQAWLAQPHPKTKEPEGE